MTAAYEAFGTHNGNWSPAPGGTTVHSSTVAFKVLSSGDHVVILKPGMGGGYAHHGIVVSDIDGSGSGMQIAEFASPSHDEKLRDARLQLTPFDKFLAGFTTFGVVPYAATDGSPEQQHRDVTVKRAQALAAAPPQELGTYKIVKWNCESFAWLCKTGNVNAKSRDVAQILNTIKNDLRRGEQAFKLQNKPKPAKRCVIA